MKEKILDAAARLIQQYGLKKFTIDEIAAELRISKKTIYQYFKSKDDIIREYFEVSVESYKHSMTSVLSSNEDFSHKIHAIVYSSHRYRLPINLLMEAKKFYPDVWLKIEDFKQFKLDATKDLLKEGVNSGIISPDINFGVLSKMLEEISNMFMDYDFLIENHLNIREALDEALKIIFNGIMKPQK